MQVVVLKVHEGMMAAATFVHCNTVDALQAAAQQFPSWPVLVTGHSYGGRATLQAIVDFLE